MPSVLVTGASRGIGRATVSRLVASGWEVTAGVRRSADGDALVEEFAERVTPITLDVTDEDQVEALARSLPATLDALVNNAGIVVGGPVEGLPPTELRRQLEVNVVGQAAVTQAVLPRLRSSRGRVVFVSSVSGRVATPMSGAYNASKFALEGMADALRMELAPWGIKVVLVEPAQTDTDLWRDAETSVNETVALLSDEHRRLYSRHISGFVRTIPRNQRAAVPVDTVAATIERALTAKRPRARYLPGAGARAQMLLGRMTPTPLRDLAIRAGTGVPRRV